MYAFTDLKAVPFFVNFTLRNIDRILQFISPEKKWPTSIKYASSIFILISWILGEIREIQLWICFYSSRISPFEQNKEDCTETRSTFKLEIFATYQTIECQNMIIGKKRELFDTSQSIESTCSVCWDDGRLYLLDSRQNQAISKADNHPLALILN